MSQSTSTYQLRRARKERHPQATKGLDIHLALPTLLLVTFGILMVYSASYPTTNGNALRFVIRQLPFALIGWCALWIFSRLRLRFLYKLAYPALIISIIALVGVLAVGKATNGATSWFTLGPIKFQPSEMAKIALILALAKFFADHPNVVTRFKGLLLSLLAIGAVCGLILLGKDFGTTSVLVMTSFVMLFLVGVRFRHLLYMGVSSLVVGAVFIAMEPYRMNRILSFLNPEAYYDSGGYQIIRQLIALGSGGVFGLGFSKSREKFFYLPSGIAHTDSIYAVIGEELGLIFCVLVLVLFLWLGWRGLSIAANSTDRFASLTAAGLTSLILIQATTNIFVVLSLMPLTGLPLPFISYGGSSLLFSLIAVGIIANTSRYGAREAKGEKRRDAMEGNAINPSAGYQKTGTQMSQSERLDTRLSSR